MKTIVIALLALASGILIACSEDHSAGCLITHVNGVTLNPDVQFPVNGEPIALSPGDSYQIWCAREIRSFSVGEIISEDQQVLRIANMPWDADVEIRPNERDAVYRGHPVPSSANVWNGFERSSSRWIPDDWRTWSAIALVAILIAIAAIFIWRPRTDEGIEGVAANRF